MPHAAPCPCGHPRCRHWHVHPYAAVQGVCFTKEQAEIVAEVLSGTAVVIRGTDRRTAEQNAVAIIKAGICEPLLLRERD